MRVYLQNAIRFRQLRDKHWNESRDTEQKMGILLEEKWTA